METRRSWMDRETGPVLFQAHICPRNTFGKFGAKKYTTKTEDRWSKEKRHYRDTFLRLEHLNMHFFTKVHYKTSAKIGEWSETFRLVREISQTDQQTNRPTYDQPTNRQTEYQYMYKKDHCKGYIQFGQLTSEIRVQTIDTSTQQYKILSWSSYIHKYS